MDKPKYRLLLYAKAIGFVSIVKCTCSRKFLFLDYYSQKMSSPENRHFPTWVLIMQCTIHYSYDYYDLCVGDNTSVLVAGGNC